MPSHAAGANTLCARGDLNTSSTSGAASRIAIGTCSVSINSKYSRRESSTDISMKCRTSSLIDTGSGVSDSSGQQKKLPMRVFCVEKKK